VEFVEVEAVQEAVKLNESELHGRQLKVWILLFLAFTNYSWRSISILLPPFLILQVNIRILTVVHCFFLIRWHQRGLMFLEWSNPAAEVSIHTMGTPTWGHMVIVLMAMGEFPTTLSFMASGL
jgi:hypothetical protein